MPRIKDLSEYYTRPDWVRRINAMGESVKLREKMLPYTDHTDVALEDSAAD